MSLSASMMPVTIAVMQAVFGVLVGPFLLAFAGGWLGGDADPADIRHAYAWGYVPFAVASAGWAFVLMAFGGRPSGVEFTSPAHWLALPLMLAVLVCAPWSVATQVLALAEVQRFSIWRSIASMVIVLTPVLLLGML